LVCEVFGAAAQRPADLEQRVGLVAAMAQRLVLDAPADLVEGLVAQPHDVEGVEDAHRVGQFGAQRGRVAAEGIQRRHGDPVRPHRFARGDPVRVGLAGAAAHHVQQTRRAARGQVDDAGSELGAAGTTGVLPQVLVDAQAGHRVQPTRVLDQRLTVIADRTHHGVLAHA
jgi:hypothetical protein